MLPCLQKQAVGEPSTQKQAMAEPSVEVDGQPRSVKRQDTDTMHAHGIRTQADAPVPADKALQKLKDGNARFVEGKPLDRSFDADNRQALAQHGQNPFATILGCADSRCPIEILFDVQPGDIFVLRNAGNTCTHAEGSMVGSMEYSVGHLHTNLVIVLGHTKCGAIVGATGVALSKKEKPRSDEESTLEKLLGGLGPVALQAAAELPSGSSTEEVAAHAIKVNVFHTIEKLLTYSKPLREKVRQGEVVVQGAIYDIISGKVDFLGLSPRQSLIMDMETSLIASLKDKTEAAEVSQPSATAGGA